MTSRRHTDRRLALGLALACALMAAAMAVPAATGWDVHVRWFPPLHAIWDPRLGPGTFAALFVGGLGATYGAPLASVLTWRRLLAVSWAAGVAWLLSLALVDGPDGIGKILGTSYEYLRTARATHDLPHTISIYISKIPYDAPTGNWPVHIAGHPPGALTFFVLLDRIGLGGGFAAGLVVTLIAATTAIAVLVTLCALGAEALARRVAPLLVLGPAAIWQAVSADGMFAAVAAWGIAALALAATRRGPTSWGFSVLAGLLLGYAVMLSYGLPLLGILALAVLIAGRNWRPFLPAAVAACVVVGVYAALGFAWWEAIGVLHGRYWDGVAHNRPASYWMWGNLAALCFCAGPLLGAGIAALTSVREQTAGSRVVLLLGGAAVLMVLAADVSQMSKAEVERIWLPFVPWLLISTALLPQRWRSRGLWLQVGFALLVQHLLDTGW